MINSIKQDRQHLWILLACTALGLGLRLFNLTGKPLWTDEFATLVFSLGHGFKSIPLNQVISSEILLQPLVPDVGLHFGGVVEHLLGESNHPPLYFLLTHLWLQMFPTSEGLVSLWGARSLSALFGAAAIPAIFGLGYLIFRSRWIAHAAALLMATSPLGIYLAQEARHYTLPILWTIASVACLFIATRALLERRSFPIGLALVWIVINGLGVATHYFFSLVVGAEGLVVLGVAGYQLKRELKRRASQPALMKGEIGEYLTTPMAALQSTWLRIGAVAMGTLASMVVWLPFLEGVQDSEITQWIHRSGRAGLEWLDPVFQILAGVITMLYMLPIQADYNPIRVVSYVGLILLAIGTSVIVIRGLRRASGEQDAIRFLSGFAGGAIAIFLVITYGFEREVTSAPRYHFVFFPAILLLVAAGLITLWQQSSQRRVVITIMAVSLIGSICVITNLGYQKVHRPEVVAQAMRSVPPRKNLVAIVHRTHGQTGRLMGIAWDLKHRPLPEPSPPPLFLMTEARDTTKSTLAPLDQAFKSQSVPLNLWLLNFKGIDEADLQRLLINHQCEPTPQVKSAIDGYRYQLYTCE